MRARNFSKAANKAKESKTDADCFKQADAKRPSQQDAGLLPDAYLPSQASMLICFLFQPHPRPPQSLMEV